MSNELGLGEFLEADLEDGAQQDLASFKGEFLSYLQNPRESGDAFSKAAGAEGRRPATHDGSRSDQAAGSSGAKRDPIKARA